MHMAKPEQAIFEAVAQVTGKGPDVIFTDDLEANRLAAERYVGWRTLPALSI